MSNADARKSKTEPGSPAAGWQPGAPRDEIRPAFSYKADGGPNGRGSHVITADAREGLDGWWARTFPVVGGKHYRFSALYRATGVVLPRSSVMAKIDWRDAAGRPVEEDRPTVTNYLVGMGRRAETEHPTTGRTTAGGW